MKKYAHRKDRAKRIDDDVVDGFFLFVTITGKWICSSSTIEYTLLSNAIEQMINDLYGG